MYKILENKTLIYSFAVLILGIYIFPYLNLDESHIRSQDNLDSYYIYYHNLVQSDALFVMDPNYELEGVMNGLPRFCFPSAFNVTSLSFYFFGSRLGYTINFILIHLIGFFGMFLLLENFVLKDERQLWLKVLISLCFALLPVFSVWGLSVLGQPLLLYALLKIRDKEAQYYHWIIVVAFPLYSFFVFLGFFALLFLGCWVLYEWISHKKTNLNLIFASILLGTMYILVDFQLFYGMFFVENFVSHRAGALDANLNFKGVIVVAIYTFFNGWYHSANYVGIIFIGLAFLAIALGFRNKWNIKPVIFLMGLTALLAGLYAFMDWTQLVKVAEHLPILDKFSLKRFHFLLPFSCFLMFIFSLKLLMQLKNMEIPVLLCLLILLGLNFNMNYNFEHNGYNMDFFKLANHDLEDELTFQEYFDEELFTKAAQFIDKPQSTYRVASLGISPSILQFNGFYTLDSYQNLYRKSYSEWFFKINEAEYKKANLPDKRMGNRCYLFSSELHQGADKITQLDLDFEALKKANCTYLFSYHEIMTVEPGALSLSQVFESELTDTKLYFYQLN